MSNSSSIISLRHFKTSEFACNHCGELPKLELMTLVDQIRHDYGKPITISSGKRCATHNVAIGGAKNSRHVVGDACDMVRTPELLAFVLANMERYQVCVEDPKKTLTWIHVDMLNRGGWRVFKI